VPCAQAVPKIGAPAAFWRNHRLAFQVTDDILDVEESSAGSEDSGKDMDRQKATYPQSTLGALSSVANDVAPKASPSSLPTRIRRASEMLNSCASRA